MIDKIHPMHTLALVLPAQDIEIIQSALDAVMQHGGGSPAHTVYLKIVEQTKEGGVPDGILTNSALACQFQATVLRETAEQVEN